MVAYDPLVKGGNYRESLTAKVTAYNDETLAVGGYWTASLTLTVPLWEAERWYEEGLGVQICVYNHVGILRWKGFVDQVTLNAGALSEVRGPLMNIGNRVSAAYSPLDPTVYPPVTGATTVTIIAEDATSQAQYGIFEKVVSAGTATDANAEKVRDVFLEENSQPESSGELSIAPGSAQSAVITLDCLGYVHTLKNWIYYNPGTTYSYLSDKLKTIMLADPNSIIFNDFSQVADNLFLTPDVEDENRFAWDIVLDMLTLGNDTDDARRLFGVYDHERVRYQTMPSEITYHHRLGDPDQRVTTPDGVTVYPWDVQPGKWMYVPDFLVGRAPVSVTTPADLRKDPRNKFLESVRYTAPWGLDLSGGKTDRLSQLLAKLTFTGGML